MAILEGTTEDGALVPVEVTTAGRVVAEGLTGPEGPQGPQGEKGDKGDKGDQGDPGSPGNLWSGTDPGDISYTGGNVGIGLESPDGLLHLKGSNPNCYFETSNPNEEADLVFRSHVGGDQGLVRYSLADNSLRFATNGAGNERVRIDSSGRFLVGTTSAIDSSTSSVLQIESTVGAYAIVGRDDASLVAGSTIGGMRFYGKDSDDNYNECARIQAQADGTHTTTSKPSRLIFWTTAAGASSPTERMRIDSQGDVIFQGAPIIRSPDGTHWAIEVDNSGNLSAVQAI